MFEKELWKDILFFPTTCGKHAMFIATGRHPKTLDEERHGSHDITESLDQPLPMFALPLDLILNNILPNLLTHLVSSCFSGAVLQDTGGTVPSSRSNLRSPGSEQMKRLITKHF